MSVAAAFSTCRIQFTLNDKIQSDRIYSDRSLIELRQNDFGNYSIRALDIENDKTEIFSFHFNEEGQYKIGGSPSQPDEIRLGNGTYRFWLTANARTKFHEALRTSLQETILMSETSSSPTPEIRERVVSPKSNRRSPPPKPKTDKTKPNIVSDRDVSPEPNRRSPPPKPKTNKTKPNIVSDRNDLIVDVYRLGEYIREGNVNRATEIARQLADQHVRLQSTTYRQQSNENQIQIKIKIDGADRSSDDEEDDLTMGVYPSTTIRELRAAFEYSNQFPPTSQYFFVNGHLAHDNSSMVELNVHSNSLFVLFLIQP